MSDFTPTDHGRIRRKPQRGRYDRQTIYDIIDEAFICHVGLLDHDRPIVIPTIHARQEDRILLHGAKASRLLKHAAAGHPICITFTLLDGLVLARSVFHHSMNYRSVVLFGHGREVTDPDEKMRGLERLTDHLVPGRWADARRPTEKEMHATALVAVDIEDASAKIRTGPPGDDAADYDLPVWAGVVPITQHLHPADPDPALRDGIPQPPYVADITQNRTKA